MTWGFQLEHHLALFFFVFDFVCYIGFKLKLFKYPDLSAGEQKRDLEEIPLGK